MDCWPSAPDRMGRPLLLALLFAGLLFLPAQAGDEEHPSWEFDSWLNLGTGYESESRVDPDLNRAVVPGGSFLNFTPSASLTRRIGSRSRLMFSASGSMERYFNDDERLFIGLSGLGELTLRSRGRFYGRLGLGGEYFDDSEIETARRTGLSSSGAVGWGNDRRALELTLGARQRAYSDLIVEDDAGIPGTYDETTTSVGAALFGLTSRSSLLRGEIALLSTDARDPSFDSSSWLLRGDARLARSTRWTTSLSTIYQRREFDQRAADENVDDYLRLGLRLERSLGGKRLLSLQYAYAVYGEPDGADDDTHRVAIYFVGRFGRAARPGPPPTHYVEESDAINSDGSVLFRIQDEEAAAVSVVGDFSGWDAGRHPMRKSRNGWWELTVRIDPGSHQYAFVIDGEYVPPPNAETMVDDGFGGRNGLLVIPQ
jgi:hypothetical protein